MKTLTISNFCHVQNSVRESETYQEFRFVLSLKLDIPEDELGNFAAILRGRLNNQINKALFEHFKKETANIFREDYDKWKQHYECENSSRGLVLILDENNEELLIEIEFFAYRNVSGHLIVIWEYFDRYIRYYELPGY